MIDAVESEHNASFNKGIKSKVKGRISIKVPNLRKRLPTEDQTDKLQEEK